MKLQGRPHAGHFGNLSEKQERNSGEEPGGNRNRYGHYIRQDRRLGECMLGGASLYKRHTNTTVSLSGGHLGLQMGRKHRCLEHGSYGTAVNRMLDICHGPLILCMCTGF